MSKEMINDLITDSNGSEQVLKDETISRELFPQSIDCLMEIKLEKVRQLVLDDSNVSVFVLESVGRELDDLMCLISGQLNDASQLKSNNQTKLVETLKTQSSSTTEPSNLSETQTIPLQPITKQYLQLIDPSEYSPRYYNPTTESLFSELPSDLLIHIGTFLFAKDLLNLGQSHSRLLKIYFNQTPHKAISLYRMKHIVEFDIVKQRKLLMEEQIEEYKKDERESFSQVQEFIWKVIACLVYPRLRNLKISNWMHVLRRRITYVRLKEPNKLPLYHYERSEMLKSWNPIVFDKVSVPFIENCDRIYKCPMNYDDLPETQTTVRYCNVCSKTRGLFF